MDLTKILLNCRTARDCERSFLAVTALGFICIVIFYISCLLEQDLPHGVFLASMAYCIPGAVLFLFSASLCFARWQFLSKTRE